MTDDGEREDQRKAKAKALLTEHVEFLRRHILELAMAPPLRSTYGDREFVGPSMRSDIERLEFIADAIERALSDKAPSLDHAFGLKRGRGKPGSKDGRPGIYFTLICDVIARRASGQKWNEICHELDYDERELRKIYAREKDAALAWYAEQINS